MIFLNGLSLPLLLCAYALLAAFWVSIRSKGQRHPDEWSIFGTITFYGISIAGLLTAPIGATVWALTRTPILDRIVFAWMGALAAIMCFILGFCTITTLVELRRFSNKNAELSKSVARHALIMGTIFFAALIVLLILVFVTTDTFTGFMVGRNMVPLYVTYVIRLAVAIYYKHKRKYEGKEGRGSVMVDVKAYAEVTQSLLEEEGEDHSVYREGGF